jgi:hypothetical protein
MLNNKEINHGSQNVLRVLTWTVKEGQQKYCESVYSRSGINHMWILKNSKDLLDNLKSRSFSQVSRFKKAIYRAQH